jgi:hypothetical protein
VGIHRVPRSLNEILREAVGSQNEKRTAGRPDFTFVTGISRRFETHGYCTGGGSPNPVAWFWPRYVSTLGDAISSEGDPRGTMHPNDLGHREIADTLVERVLFLLREPKLVAGVKPRPAVAGEEGTVCG